MKCILGLFDNWMNIEYLMNNEPDKLNEYSGTSGALGDAEEAVRPGETAPGSSQG